VYAGAEQSSSAANFGTQGITFHARKASTDEEWQQALEALSCDVRGSGEATLNGHAQHPRLQEG
jgi:hypothetical protein